ncbi:GNAT family N-acetyltransferase [Bacillus marinisedimentorum]|uniref:GNAT family N-acetyltransferase n=1 Tax=Bacillus marinisedimentorum TaxID=1821260 RepID=UPI0007E1A455|nr:GNAT family N-acetyltransferase [Bacillus marinisedimentorum]
MEIRRLAPNDAEQYWVLRLEALQNNPEAFVATYDEAAARQNAVDQTAERLGAVENDTYGAFIEQELAGVVTLHGERPGKMEHKGHIFAMYVSPAARRKGAGKALISKAINRAKERGLEQLHLAVIRENKAAKRLYESAGFKTYGVEKHAMKSGNKYWDEELMCLFLEKDLD